ncbi:hypothetical protein AB0M46_05715 [Dactylosporangium sp. NPDC051485]|uniref:hypothetical protein n=1 Tax=Dactylosporangium sp. NPDC051485 TaxID=3154846 RepID=UPI00341BDC32
MTVTVTASGTDMGAGPPPAPATPSARERFRPSREAEARLLLLIDAFSLKANGTVRYLEGRVKLAKLDFLLRYPKYLQRVLLARGVGPEQAASVDPDEAPLDARMVRYRYGPWDPSYYAVLGSLIGRGLVEVAPLSGSAGFGYRTSTLGAQLAADLRTDESFARITDRLRLLRRYLDKSGNVLKNYLYELPEIADAAWHEDLT